MRASLDGILARIRVTEADINALNAFLNTFFKKHKHTVVFEENRKDGGADLILRGAQPVPQEVAVSVGMIAHNMRATLDGLACQLAILAADGHPREEDLFQVQFPIRIHGPRSVKQYKSGLHERRFTRQSGNFKPLGRYLARLEKLQPYKRGRGHRECPLWLLDRLNNADKHRLVVVLATVSGSTKARFRVPRSRVVLPGGRPAFIARPGLRINTAVPLVDGAKIGHVKRPSEVNMEIKVVPIVRFGNACAAVAGRGVMETLIAMRDEVCGIVESFRPEFS